MVRPGTLAMMKRRKSICLLTLVAAASLTLAACGGDDSSGTVPNGYAGDSNTNSKGLSTGTGNWLRFGRLEQRTHYLPAPDELNPPVKQEWSFSDRVLIEFPPALHDGTVFLADKYGDVRALRLEDQKVLWDLQKSKQDVGPPSDTTAPAYFDGHVFVAFQHGELVSLDAETGKVEWRRNMQTGLQSSPLAVEGMLYLGSEKGTLFALDPDTGRTVWTKDAVTPIKASPSLDNGTVFYANYSGTMFAADAKSGRLKWSTDTSKTAPGGDGGFYSSPAATGGKVFAGRDDGIVYAFDQKTGKQSWFFQAEGDIYGSPAVAKVPGTPLTVYIGSYDSRLYALNAKSGVKEWDYDVGGEIPGTATVIGHTVYTSSFATGYSIGVDVKTRKKTFSYPSPGYTPMISDGKNLYLVGYYTLHGFKPES